MKLRTEPYQKQVERWPGTGRQILAHHDETSIVVYQAYRPAIGHFAARNGYFGGEFSLGRMSWIKPNFLWMMYRSGWGTKEGQEVILAVHLKRSAFDEMVGQAVHSTFIPALYGSEADWQKKLKHSEVRVQWDPDHNPSGQKLERKALQLGLRGTVLTRYAREWIVEIEDISDFVATQRPYALKTGWADLVTPCETLYFPQPPAKSHNEERHGRD
ncbi:MAG: DUF4291 domain-containing protein [Blastocatellia bacterium]|nr:DUF4291 domain-containing protein [Blastocatellia bacterium]